MPACAEKVPTFARNLYGSLWIILVTTLNLPGQVSADEFLPRTNPKVQNTEQVFRAVIRAVGDNRTPPEFRMVRGKSSAFDVAMFSPKSHRVMIEERFYDLVQGLPSAMAPHALALIIGHELAHFYRNHSWAFEFGKAFAERQPNTNTPRETISPQPADPTERRRIEAEADYFGGFYSFLAGYRPLSVAPQVYDAVYKEYRFNETLPAYEHLRLRKEAAQEAQGRLQQLVPLFEAGVYLTVMKEYLDAARIFERIAADFPGPEMLNNAGVALANESLRWLEEAERRFAYPLELDSETRLADEGGRGASDISEEGRRERRMEFLRQAKALFERAINAQPTYTTAAVNLACVLDLLGQPDLALETAKAVLAQGSLDGRDEFKPQAYLIAGVAEAHRGHNEEARKAFMAARLQGSPLADENLAALSISGSDHRVRSATKTVKPIQPEAVGGLTVADFRTADVLAGRDSKTIGLWEADEERPELRVVTTQKGTVRAISVMRGPAAKRSTVIFLSATPGSHGKTLRGLTIGEPVSQVEARYGTPVSIVTSRRGRYYVYENPYRGSLVGLLIRIDVNQVVRDWVAYRVDE